MFHSLNNNLHVVLDENLHAGGSRDHYLDLQKVTCTTKECAEADGKKNGGSQGSQNGGGDNGGGASGGGGGVNGARGGGGSNGKGGSDGRDRGAGDDNGKDKPPNSFVSAQYWIT